MVYTEYLHLKETLEIQFAADTEPARNNRDRCLKACKDEDERGSLDPDFSLERCNSDCEARYSFAITSFLEAFINDKANLEKKVRKDGAILPPFIIADASLKARVKALKKGDFAKAPVFYVKNIDELRTWLGSDRYSTALMLVVTGVQGHLSIGDKSLSISSLAGGKLQIDDYVAIAGPSDGEPFAEPDQLKQSLHTQLVQDNWAALPELPAEGSVSVHPSDTKTHQVTGSVPRASDTLHFVTVKGSGRVTLQLTLKPNNPAYQKKVRWTVDDQPLKTVSKDNLTAFLSRAESKKMNVVVSIGTTVIPTIVWVIWSTLKAETDDQSRVDKEALGLYHRRASMPPAYVAECRIDWIAAIEPASIVTDRDRPDIESQQPVAPPLPPGIADPPHTFYGWEVCRQLRDKTFKKRGGRKLPPEGHKYPSGDQAFYTSATPTSPYRARPPFSGNVRDYYPLEDADGKSGDYERWRWQSRVFVRVQLGETWYRCSEKSIYLFRWHESASRSDERWDVEPGHPPMFDLTNDGFDLKNK